MLAGTGRILITGGFQTCIITRSHTGTSQFTPRVARTAVISRAERRTITRRTSRLFFTRGLLARLITRPQTGVRERTPMLLPSDNSILFTGGSHTGSIITGRHTHVCVKTHPVNPVLLPAWAAASQAVVWGSTGRSTRQ